MKIINLTPHEITVIGKELGQEWKYPASGQVARCSVTRELVDYVQETWIDDHGIEEEGVIPVYVASFGAVEGLPPAQPDTVYLVSSLVAQALRGRKDLLSPDDTVRDKAGQIIGCRGFARVTK